VTGTNLYVGGEFTMAGGIAANRIVRWNGSSWSALGSGVAGGFIPAPGVYELVVSGSNVYAAGNFTTAGGGFAFDLAKWNGSSWSALGSGINGGGGSVNALAVSSTTLYVGGSFTTAGGSAANNIAEWNGSSWAALGPGMNGQVLALAVAGTDLYAGGLFTTAGGNAATRIAKWDGSSWTALGSGMNDRVYALAVSGSDVYAGGWFTTAGGNGANYIAKWDGSSWSALGPGLGGGAFPSIGVVALAVSGSDVYAGGWFTTAGGSPAKYIAKWDGSIWIPLGSGMNNAVWDLALSGSDLYAAGYFTTAGGKASGYIARAYLPPLPALSMFHSGPDVTVSWPSADTADFALQQATSLAPPTTWVSNTAPVTDDGTSKSVTLPATNTAQFFRLRRP
jgi:hypothetical protein